MSNLLEGERQKELSPWSDTHLNGWRDVYKVAIVAVEALPGRTKVSADLAARNATFCGKTSKS